MSMILVTFEFCVNAVLLKLLLLAAGVEVETEERTWLTGIKRYLQEASL